MKDNNKPKEIDAIELDKFYLLVDEVIDKLEESKKPKRDVEKDLTFKELTPQAVNPDGNNLSNLNYNGLLGPMMVVLFNTATNQYIGIYPNATVCAKEFNLNPTTIRQRASSEKVIDNVRWSYINQEQYNELIK